MNVGYVIGIAGVLVGLIAIPITYLIGQRSRQTPQLRYAVDFDVLLKPDEKLLDKGLSMTIGDHEINRISRTRVAFWNQRGDTVRSADIVQSDPLRIQFDDDDIPLQTRLLSISREQTQLGAVISETAKSTVSITFDFLDSGDGGVFEIVHQGGEPPIVTGTVRGAKKFRSVRIDELGPSELAAMAERSSIRRLRKNIGAKVVFSFCSLVLAAAIVLLAGLVTYKNTNELVNACQYNLHTLQGQADFSAAVQSSQISQGATIRLAVTLLLVGALCIFGIWSQYRIIRRRIPRSIVAHLYPLP